MRTLAGQRVLRADLPWRAPSPPRRLSAPRNQSSVCRLPMPRDQSSARRPRNQCSAHPCRATGAPRADRPCRATSRAYVAHPYRATSPPRRLSITRKYSTQVLPADCPYGATGAPRRLSSQLVIRTQAVRTGQVLCPSPPRSVSMPRNQSFIRRPLLPRNQDCPCRATSHPRSPQRILPSMQPVHASSYATK